MELTRIPDSACDLIKWLDEAIPHRCPSRGMAERDIWFYAGKRDLIDALKSRLEATKEAPENEKCWTAPAPEE